ncbi:hypothetical protein J6590_062657 [Homalodisca vitripennis]|nr:hypothetical protein J6590_062657 [Homalodisca vitripennis]
MWIISGEHIGARFCELFDVNYHDCDQVWVLGCLAPRLPASSESDFQRALHHLTKVGAADKLSLVTHSTALDSDLDNDTCQSWPSLSTPHSPGVTMMIVGLSILLRDDHS